MGDEIETPVKETVETVSDPVDKAIPDPVEEVTEHPENEIPPWGKELTDKVDSLLERIAGAVDPTDEQDIADEVTDMPGDGHIVPDESPAKKPWTHRSPVDLLFGGKR